MNTTIRRKGSRLVAGFVAAGIGVAAALGMATPAMAAPDASNIDMDALGSLTVHKHETPDPVSTSRSTGSELDVAPANPLEGVTFSVREVTHPTALDLEDSTTWETLHELTPAQVLADGSGYSLGAAVSDTTDAAGEADFTSLPVGVYLVEETSVGDNPIALRSQPFLVSIPLPENGAWVYDVHVYPKNSLTGITLEQDLTGAVALGDTIVYTVTTEVPNKQADNTITEYAITDVLDTTQVAYVPGSAVVTLVDGGTTTELVEGIDYELSVVDGVVKATLTDEGLVKVNAANNGAKVVLELDATVIALGDGSIENDASLTIRDSQYSSTIEAVQVVSYWGAARIIKHPSTDDTLRLQGAVFEVRLPGTTTAIPVGTATPRQTQFTTGEDGEVVVPALIAGDYELVEVVAPVGYQLNPTPIPFTVTAGSTADAVQIEVANSQVPAFALPITGGDGQMAFMIGGGALLVVAAGAFLILAGRRRSEQQQG
ncbi:SpaH/EbpB family LPXTG-anchored major pilin [Agrococcus sp. SL85]|uniref:SpaH/EbpB family LPXTG-anchored major pilin n=1 Tax=Agrococcus sp. SL85 TaxID=2995141 RepID=UPI00226CAB6C|nr:SpaH/EbpB family LPXTG-anchored major pilin [Agrococcus sp. SL85]WAC67246.1 SpaH/EbpB family LPXTG-anchored major pilin [Agrococcus sp. SL85]